MLIESIYKEISATSGMKSSGGGEDMSSLVSTNCPNTGADDSDHPRDKREAPTGNDLESLLRARNFASSSLLDELKTRKMSTNNWNQKITIELVECKIKLKQLIMEM